MEGGKEGQRPAVAGLQRGRRRVGGSACGSPARGAGGGGTAEKIASKDDGGGIFRRLGRGRPGRLAGPSGRGPEGWEGRRGGENGSGGGWSEE